MVNRPGIGILLRLAKDVDIERLVVWWRRPVFATQGQQYSTPHIHKCRPHPVTSEQ